MAERGGIIRDAHRFAPAAPEESVVYGACSPGWHSAGPHAAAVDQWIECVRAAGIERVCCLLPGRQLDAGDANVGRYRDAFGEANVLHAPVPDHRLADPGTLRREVLPFLAAADRRSEPVVVHCLSGIGRTGVVLAAWLVHGRGYGREQALETVSRLGRDPREPLRRGTATDQELDDLLESVV
jgi:hypothetical protein